MGYYSSVVITLFENDYNSLVVKASQECPRALDLIKNSRLGHIDNIVTMYWDCIKWYQTFEEVNFIMHFIKSGIKYNFKLIGEEDCDVEEVYNDDDWELGGYTEITREFIIHGSVVDSEEYIENALQNYREQQEANSNRNDEDIEDISEEELLKIIA